jgi:hypothetical protein
MRISSRGIPEDFFAQIKLACNSIFETEIQYDFENLSKKVSNVHFELNYSKNRGAPPGELNVLILWEPQTVIPWQYKSEVLEKFQLIVPVSPWRADRLGVENWILHPVVINEFPRLSTKRKKKLVMINGAKFSANGSSLYGFRRAISRSLYKNGIEYDLMGVNWKMNKFKEARERLWAFRKEVIARNTPSFKEAFSDFFYKYPEYRGEVSDKIFTLSQYKYSLVIENEADWITEKLIDSIVAKTVPIYVGPRLDRFEFLSKCVYQCEPNIESILKIVVEDDSEMYLQKKKNIDNLNPNELEIFSYRYNLNKLACITRDYLLDRQLSQGH